MKNIYTSSETLTFTLLSDDLNVTFYCKSKRSFWTFLLLLWGKVFFNIDIILILTRQLT